MDFEEVDFPETLNGAVDKVGTIDSVQHVLLRHGVGKL